MVSMASRIGEIIIDCSDPEAAAAFWCAALGYREFDRDETGMSSAIQMPVQPRVVSCLGATSGLDKPDSPPQENQTHTVREEPAPGCPLLSGP
jgi:catechol 2,3-dioxygenase-like lactoylglutathione lyase family enzyme